MQCIDCKTRPRRFGSYCRQCHKRRSLASKEKHKKELCTRCGQDLRHLDYRLCIKCLKDTSNNFVEPAKTLPDDMLGPMIQAEQKRIEAEERLLKDSGHDLTEMTGLEADRYLCEALSV